MQQKILILKNITREWPGLLEDLLKEKSIKYEIVDLSKNEKLPSPEGYNAVAVLGGPDSANDKTPKIQKECDFVKKIY
jgi:GMP synthase (glutamine-hydrolysing)